MPPVTIPGTEVLEVSGATGEYRIFLAVPDLPPPPGGFPTLYLLDANACFGMAAEILRHGMLRQKTSRIAPAILAGIAYPTEGLFDRERRGFDYTAGPPAGEAHGGRSGGRDAFRDLLARAVKPLVGAHAPADPARQAIIGHSLAGFFVLDLLANDPGLFQGHAAISPSVWWDRERLSRGLRAPGQADMAPQVTIAVGEWEQALAPWECGLPDSDVTAQRRGRRAMVDGACGIAEDIACCMPRARVQFECLAGETHASAIPVGLSHAMRFLLGPEGFGGG